MKKLKVIIAFLITIFVFNYSKSAIRCSEVFQRKGEIIEADPDFSLSARDVFHFRDNNSWFYFKAKLEEGKLTVKASLVDLVTGDRSSVKGSDLYKEMILHFGIERIDVISGRWFPFSKANYGAFFTALKQGKNSREAAFSTWTGQQVLKYGFEFVEVTTGYTRFHHDAVRYVKADFSKSPKKPSKNEKSQRLKVEHIPPMEF